MIATLLTAEELARALNVSTSWVYKRTQQGQAGIPHIKVGKSVRFDFEEVKSFLKNLGEK